MKGTRYLHAETEVTAGRCSVSFTRPLTGSKMAAMKQAMVLHPEHLALLLSRPSRGAVSPRAPRNRKGPNVKKPEVLTSQNDVKAGRFASGVRRLAAAMAVAIVLCSGCRQSPEDALYDRALLDKTGAAAKEYLTRHPEGNKAWRVAETLDHFEYHAALESKTLEGYVAYLRGNSPRIGQSRMRERLRILLFLPGVSKEEPADPRSALERYLELEPSGEFAANARAALDNIAWLDAYHADTEAAYVSYLSRCPLGKYCEEAASNLRRKEAAIPYVNLGMTRAEVQRKLGTPAAVRQLYQGVSGVAQYGYFFCLEYPDLGITCNVRRTQQLEKVFSISFNENYSGTFRGVRIGMTKEQVTSVMGEPRGREQKPNRFEYLAGGITGPRSGWVITFKEDLPGDTDHGDLIIRITGGFIPGYRVRWSESHPVLDGDAWGIVLSGERLNVTRNAGEDCVIGISSFDDTIRGSFLVAPR